ncbi:Predicted arabinose efflux permease, MFS family [Actinacidiphila yanglinensis]|uniref:Predicted arabinose efflux permease, MFS family n=1 Tax=Actinacidiphila yanglinensis TaxID=310779 RepID=A0A1H6E256_9ACTN|nr:MFS transporter [Actinacidiphila yanglinensis]SEG91672.1 Predicted arabinose efflux permease, MFS family [Actinacidiphila yanglinensis]
MTAPDDPSPGPEPAGTTRTDTGGDAAGGGVGTAGATAAPDRAAGDTRAAAGRTRALSRAFSSLSIRNYRLYFWGYSVSIAGTWMQTLALAFLVLHLTGSGADLGISTGARFLPLALLGPFGGLIADRYDRRRLLYLTQSASAAVAVAFALMTGLGAASFGGVVALSLALGVLTVFDNPARQSLIGDLVPREQLANAVTLNSVSVNLARVLGAAAGGALVAGVGLTTCFVLNALSFAGVLVSLVLMRPAEMNPVDRPPREKGQVRAGLRYARSTPALLLPLVMITITGALAYEFPVTLPLVARGALHGGAGTYGAMAAVMAIGAVLGGLVVAGRGNPRHSSSLAVASVGWGVAITAAALAPTLPWELLALLFVGYGGVSFNSLSKTALQLAAAPAMRGRVMALWALAWGGTTVIGGPLVGWVAQDLGSRWSLVVGGVPTLLLGIVMLPALRRVDRSAAAATSQAGTPA